MCIRDRTRPLDNPILISDLLTHTAGFTYDFMLGHPAIGLYKKNGLHDYKNIETQEEMNLDEFCNKLSTLPLLFEPGEKWHYSCSIDVLGRVIEVVSGMSLGDFFKENIFKPLEMEDTGFYVENDKHERFSDCYQTMLGSKKKKMTIRHIAGKDEYTLNAALVINSVPMLGLVGVPKKGRLFFSYAPGDSYLIENKEVKKISCKKKQPKGKVVA